MIKIAHESPKSIFKTVQDFTDYDYALVHLFEEDPEYLKQFQDAKEAGREIILDNSIFELEEAFDAEKFAGWVLELKPDWYIVPDALEDAKKTVQQMTEWNNKYKNLPGKKIGVVQGKTYSQIKTCYEYMDKIANVDMIAISFDYSYYLEVCPHPNKWMGYALGRVQTLTRLLQDGVINIEKPHHLLGCALPIEFMFYRQGFDWLESLDTSSPIVHALLGIGYEPGGLDAKKSIKLIELLNTPEPSVATMHTIKHNIQYFRSYIHGYR
jgi:hypothetical protein